MIYVIVRNRFYIGEQVTLGHSACLTLACYFDDGHRRLSKDISKWAKTVKHGDTYMINSKLHLLAIDRDKFLNTYPDPLVEEKATSF